MRHLTSILLLLIFAACSSQDKYSDFDYSYSRTGGFAPIYENLLIKGNKVHYSYEGRQKNIKKNFTITNSDLKMIENALTENEFRKIQEDYKKLYDNISVAILVKKGDNSGSKSDSSMILEADQEKWDRIVRVFQGIIDNNVKSVPER